MCWTQQASKINKNAEGHGEVFGIGGLPRQNCPQNGGLSHYLSLVFKDLSRRLGRVLGAISPLKRD